MKRIKLTAKQRKELDRIGKFFLEATEHVRNREDRHLATVKILSRVAALSERLVK